MLRVLFSLVILFLCEGIPAVAQTTALEICPRPKAGSKVCEPEDLRSEHGLLKVRLKFLPSRFIEDNWSLGRIGGDSTDVKAGTLFGLFNFDDHHDGDHQDRVSKLFLDPATGVVLSDDDDN